MKRIVLTVVLAALCAARAFSEPLAPIERRFPILSLSPERHSVRHLVMYSGLRFPKLSKMTEHERALAAALASAQRTLSPSVTPSQAREVLQAACSKHELSSKQCIAFFYRATLGIFEPNDGGAMVRTEYKSPLQAIEESLVSELDARGLLVKHRFYGASSTTVAVDFVVKRGTGTWLKHEIESRLVKLADPLLISDSKYINLLEGKDNETVEWIYEN